MKVLLPNLGIMSNQVLLIIKIMIIRQCLNHAFLKAQPLNIIQSLPFDENIHNSW
jgi:hypothetical protein